MSTFDLLIRCFLVFMSFFLIGASIINPSRTYILLAKIFHKLPRNIYNYKDDIQKSKVIFKNTLLALPERLHIYSEKEGNYTLTSRVFVALIFINSFFSLLFYSIFKSKDEFLLWCYIIQLSFLAAFILLNNFFVVVFTISQYMRLLRMKLIIFGFTVTMLSSTFLRDDSWMVYGGVSAIYFICLLTLSLFCIVLNVDTYRSLSQRNIKDKIDINDIIIIASLVVNSMVCIYLVYVYISVEYYGQSHTDIITYFIMLRFNPAELTNRTGDIILYVFLSIYLMFVLFVGKKLKDLKTSIGSTLVIPHFQFRIIIKNIFKHLLLMLFIIVLCYYSYGFGNDSEYRNYLKAYIVKDDEVGRTISSFQQTSFFSKPISGVIGYSSPDGEACYSDRNPLDAVIMMIPQDGVRLEEIELRMNRFDVASYPLLTFKQLIENGSLNIYVTNHGWGPAWKCNFILNDNDGLLKKFFDNKRLVYVTDEIACGEQKLIFSLKPENINSIRFHTLLARPVVDYRLFYSMNASYRDKQSFPEVKLNQSGFTLAYEESGGDEYYDTYEGVVSFNTDITLDETVLANTSDDTRFLFYPKEMNNLGDKETFAMRIIPDKTCSFDFVIILTFSDGSVVTGKKFSGRYYAISGE